MYILFVIIIFIFFANFNSNYTMEYIFSIVFEFIDHVPDSIRMWLFLILFVFYEPVCNAFGTTLGNYIVKIRVRKYQ